MGAVEEHNDIGGLIGGGEIYDVAREPKEILKSEKLEQEGGEVKRSGSANEWLRKGEVSGMGQKRCWVENKWKRARMNKVR